MLVRNDTSLGPNSPFSVFKRPLLGKTNHISRKFYLMHKYDCWCCAAVQELDVNHIQLLQPVE